MELLEILKKLRYVSSKSGIEFLDLSNNFPLLVKELDSVVNSQSQLSSFDSILKELHIAVERHDELLNQNKTFLDNFKNKNDELFHGIIDKVSLLNSMQNIILGIKDESENMEVIALNAMVVSIRSGKEGQAFSYITANLKQSSKRLIKQSDILIETEKAVQSLIKELESNIMQVMELNKTSEQFDKIDNKESISISNSISYTLKSMLEEAKLVKNPIVKAMEGIQIQDIIRQSLDDILMALEKVKSIDDGETPEQRLEIVCTNAKLLQLSLTCLDGVENNLNSSINVFKSNSDEVNATLESVNNARQNFLPEIVDSAIASDSELFKLKDCIEKDVKNFENFIELIKSYQKIQSKVLHTVTEIQESVGKMSSCFASFKPIIGNLQYVAIAQRIEVARNEAISSIKDTVEHMANLIGETQVNVDTAQSQLQEFTDSCNTHIKRFLSESVSDSKTFDKVNFAKSTFSNELNELYYSLEDFASGFTVYSEDFFSYYSRITHSIDGLVELDSVLKETKNAIKNLLEQTNSQKEYLVSNFDLNEAEIQNQEILGFLDRFTITAHKLAVGNIEGVSVNSGASAGDITFF